MLVLICLILIGLIMGYLAGVFFKGGFGVIGDIIAGVLGALSGGFIFNSLGIYPARGWLGVILVGILGAILFIIILRFVKWALIKFKSSKKQL